MIITLLEYLNQLVMVSYLQLQIKKNILNFVKRIVKKTLFGFGLKLTDKQIKAVRNKIKKIKENTYEWNIPSILAQEKPSKKDFYAVRLYRETQPQFYKFKKW